VRKFGPENKIKINELTEEEIETMYDTIRQRNNCGSLTSKSLEERGQNVGASFDSENRICSNTVKSQRLVKWAAKYGKSEEI
jgi:predicted DsbA family dithiol-disulfide isomerase